MTTTVRSLSDLTFAPVEVRVLSGIEREWRTREEARATIFQGEREATIFHMNIMGYVLSDVLLRQVYVGPYAQHPHALHVSWSPRNPRATKSVAWSRNKLGSLNHEPFAEALLVVAFGRHADALRPGVLEALGPFYRPNSIPSLWELFQSSVPQRDRYLRDLVARLSAVVAETIAPADLLVDTLASGAEGYIRKYPQTPVDDDEKGAA